MPVAPWANLFALCLRITGFDGETRANPGVVTANQGCCVLYAPLSNVMRRTGAGVFAGSRTVGDDHLIARQFLDARSNVRHPERALDMTDAI